jgi:hypothetical protein
MIAGFLAIIVIGSILAAMVAHGKKLTRGNFYY